MDIGDSSDILAKLTEEHIEIGVVGTTVDKKVFASEELGHDKILMVTRKGHHWCRRADISLEDLLREPIIRSKKCSGTNDVVDAALSHHGIKSGDLRVCATISGNGAIKQLVLGDCGVAFISEMAVREELKHGKLCSS